MKVRVFSPEYMASLVDEANKTPRKRQHRNVHESYNEPCQRLFNAIEVDSYIRPHRHRIDPKAETLIALKGRFSLVIFTEDGEIQDVVDFGTCSEDIGVGAEIQPGVWHTVIASKPGSVLMELKAGPFDPDAAKELAPWAPGEGAAESGEYFEALKSKIASHQKSSI